MNNYKITYHECSCINTGSPALISKNIQADWYMFDESGFVLFFIDKPNKRKTKNDLVIIFSLAMNYVYSIELVNKKNSDEDKNDSISKVLEKPIK